jgi:quercetin dioxygenase-like cupin family protein
MSSFFPTPQERAHHTIFRGVDIATCAGERLMLSLVEMVPHAVVEEHAHPHEQGGMILQGRALFFIGDEQKTLGPGDVYFVPGHVRHKVIALEEPVKVLDVFTPVREEYR